MAENTPERLSALGRRIAIVGGGGKSTLARVLARAIGVPHVELDALFWKPGWVASDPAEFRARIAEVLGRPDEGWICDGNYFSKLGDLVVSRADTVIFLNMPWRVMYRRAVARGIGAAASRRRICGDNRQTWRGLVSRDSLLWWLVEHRREYLERPERVREVTPPGTRLIRLDTPRELDAFYARFGLSR